jgi:hypothetical protein
MTEGMDYEILDAPELAKRWRVPESCDPLPAVHLGKYLRFEWGHPKLVAWWARRREGYGK